MHFQQGTFATTPETQGASIQKAWELNCHVHAAADGSNIRIVANPEQFKAFQQAMKSPEAIAAEMQQTQEAVAADAAAAPAAGVPTMENAAAASPADPAPNPPQA